MPRGNSLTEEQQEELKRDLWNGMSNKDVGVKYGLAGGYVSNIRHGYNMPHIKWPDGSTGPMPQQKVDSLKNNRTFTAKVGHSVGGKKYASKAEWVDIYGGEDGYNAVMELAHAAGCYTPEDYIEWYGKKMQDERDAEAERKHRAWLDSLPPLDPNRPLPPKVVPHNEMPIDPSAVMQMPWAEVEKRFADVPIVKKAIDTPDDVHLREAICIVFRAVGGFPLSLDIDKHVMLVKKRIDLYVEQQSGKSGSDEAA